MKYKTILADPPWEQALAGKYKGRHKRPVALPYPTMTTPEIMALDVNGLADDACHLWLWTTNQTLRAGFDVMEAWGFTYLTPVVWVKPSGLGNYFISRTQTILFGYKGKCAFPLARYQPNVLFAPAVKHSAKPNMSYDFIESISPAPRLELFARRKRLGWDAWGNEVESDISL